jgi:hypothetical protein
MLQEVHEVRTRKNGPRAVNTLATEHGIAYWLVESGRAAEAAKILTRLIRDYEREPEIGPGHKDTLNARLLLTETYADAETYAEAGTYADAEPADAVIGELRELLEDCRRALGGDAWITLDVVDALALRLAQDGQAATAAEVMEDALPAYARAHGDYGVETFQARFKHVVLLHLVGETPRALTALRALVADAEAHLGPGHAETQQFRETLDAWSAG